MIQESLLEIRCVCNKSKATCVSASFADTRKDVAVCNLCPHLIKGYDHFFYDAAANFYVRVTPVMHVISNSNTASESNFLINYE